MEKQTSLFLLAITALIIIAISVLRNKKVKTKLTEKGFEMQTDNPFNKNESVIKGELNQLEQGKNSNNSSKIDGDSNIVKQG